MSEEDKKIIYAVPSYGKEVKLIVREDLEEDTGRGVARISETHRKELGVHIGDEIEIIGPRVLKVKVEEMNKNLEDEKGIHIDKIIRNRIPVAIGIKVAIRKSLI